MLQEEPVDISEHSSGIKDVRRRLRTEYCICKTARYKDSKKGLLRSEKAF